MPNNVVKTLRQEELWKKAERMTKEKFGSVDGHFDYVMGIYKRMGGLEKETFIKKVKHFLGRTKANKDLSPEVRKRLWKRSRQRSRKRRRKRRR